MHELDVAQYTLEKLVRFVAPSAMWLSVDAGMISSPTISIKMTVSECLSGMGKSTPA